MSGITKFTKSTIISALKDIRSYGWIKSNCNVNNDGAIGNTLEDLLGISKYLVLNYSGKHKQAGKKYPEDNIDNDNERIIIRFDPSSIGDEQRDWENDLIAKNRINYDNDYVPYWGFQDVYHKAGIKLGNCFYVSADVKREGDDYFYRYSDIMQLSGFSLDKFLLNIRDGNILIDFDVRTGHNHGTKFRIKQSAIPLLYEDVLLI